MNLDRIFLNFTQQVINSLSVFVSPVKIVYTLVVLYLITEVTYHSLKVSYIQLIMIPIFLLIITYLINQFKDYLNSTNTLNPIRDEYLMVRMVILLLLFAMLSLIIFFMTPNTHVDFIHNFVMFIKDLISLMMFYVMSIEKPTPPVNQLKYT